MSPGTFHPDPCGDASPEARAAREEDITCDCCGEPCERNPAGYEMAGFDICTPCIEDLL